MGKHGIEIEFGHYSKEDLANGSKQKIYRGTFLPNVAPEQGWNQVQTLDALVRKAGFSGYFRNVEREKFILIRRYQSLKFGVDFADYQK